MKYKEKKVKNQGYAIRSYVSYFGGIQIDRKRYYIEGEGNYHALDEYLKFPKKKLSYNLQSLLVKSTLCGIVGEDSNAETLEGLLEDAGLSTWGVVRVKDRMTTFKERIVTETQQVCRVDYESKSRVSSESEERFLKRSVELID